MKKLLILLMFILTVQVSFVSELQAYSDPIAPTLLALVAILDAAKLGGELFERFGLPSVLGELVGGILLGNLSPIGWISSNHCV